jgi:acyl-CoA dehydrogenase family protein 9
MRTERYEKIMRDIRIFPIFEGANDVLRSYVALNGLKPVGEKLKGLGNIGLGDPVGSLGVLADYVGTRFRPDRMTAAHSELQSLADAVTDQVKRLRGASERLLREHRGEIVHKGLQHRRLSDALADIYAQIAVIARVSALFEDQGVGTSGQERHIARSFCKRAERRVDSHLDQIERNDDEHITAIAKLAYKRGAYGYALCD